MATPVALSDYDARWPARYEAERARLAAALAPYLLAVEHVGSTAVPGLAAKPTVDIMAGLYRLADAPRCAERMERLGYEYVKRYEDQEPERRYFRRPPRAPVGDDDEFHVHMVEVGGPFWDRHLLFRDYLRSHPEAAREYEALKRKLASVHGDAREAYSDAKGPFVRKVEEAALAERSARSDLRTGRAAAAAPPPPPPGAPRPPTGSP